MRAKWPIALLPVGLVVGGFFACSSASHPPPLPPDDAKADRVGSDAPCVPVPLPAPPATEAGDADAEATPAAVGGACNCPKLAETNLGGACNAVVANWPDEGHSHVDPGTPVIYCTKPPSSGFHYWIWGAFKTYEKPVPPGFLVHDLEHGAVVIWYKCAGSCPDVEKKLQAIIDALPVDPHCIDPEAGPPGPSAVKRRVILVPDPALDTEIAASAWQWTYRATCVDPVTLNAFIGAHYNHASEDICSDGFDPTGVGPIDGGMD
jgi:hypothetical protein